ncbi:MAG: hypothetical protein WAK24_02790, partial [Candidatus Acidiferrales bacterium]
ISAAWLLHFVAWFLPVIKPGEFRPAIPGWQAFRYAACGVWACKGVQFDAWYYECQYPTSRSSVVERVDRIL